MAADVTGRSPREMLDRRRLLSAARPARGRAGHDAQRRARTSRCRGSGDAPVHSFRLSRPRQPSAAKVRTGRPPQFAAAATSSAISSGSPAAISRKCCWPRGWSRAVKLFIFDEPTVGVDVGTRVAHLRVHPRSVRGRRRHPADLVGPAGDPASHQPRLCHVSRRTARRTGRRGDHARTACWPFLRARSAHDRRERRSSALAQQSPVRAAAAVRAHRRAAVPSGHRRSSCSRSLSARFLPAQNIINVARQATYLAMVAMGQMLALLTGGFDLSVGTIVARHLGDSALGHGARCMPPFPSDRVDHRRGHASAGIGAGTLRRRRQRRRRGGVQASRPS